MERTDPNGYQRIIDNFPDLIKTTICTTELLTHLVQARALSQEDFDDITTGSKKPSDKSMRLYRILFTKTKGYDALVSALEKTNQTGPFDILRRSNKRPQTDDDANISKAKKGKYTIAPAAFTEFLKDDNEDTALILTTRDASATITKIKNELQERCIAPSCVVVTEEEVLKDTFHPQEFSNLLVVHSRHSSPFQLLEKVNELEVKVILVTEQLPEEDHNNFTLLPGVCLSNDVQKWPDLGPQVQRKILGRMICGNITVAKAVRLCSLPPEVLFTEDILLDLMKEKCPNVFQNLIPGQIQYYLERRLIPRDTVSRSILKNVTKTVLVFTGIELHKLSSFAKAQSVDTSTNQLQQRALSSKLILLTMKSDFEAVCSRTRDAVHWLHYTEKEFTWIRSKGDMDQIQEFLKVSRKQSISEDDFLEYIEKLEIADRSTAPICISDSPGMGKSKLLLQLGRKLQSKYPDRIVVFLEINHILPFLKQNDKHHPPAIMEQTKIAKLLAQICCQTELQKGLLTEILDKCTVKVELLLDGLDELQSEDVELAYTFFQRVTQHLKAVRLWVTTRPHLLLELENTLHVMGHNIVPFDEPTQQNFLVSYWSLMTVEQLLNIDTTRLTQFANHCLHTLKNNMSSKEQDFAGIPFQCLLIAEVFQEDALNYSNPDNVFAAASSLPQYKFSLAGLYQQMISKKEEIFKKRRKISETVDEETLLNIHTYLSLSLIFPEWMGTFQQKLRVDESSSPFEVALHVGFLETRSTPEAPSFVHRTIAEFFIAQFVVKMLSQECDKGFLLFFERHVSARAERRKGRASKCQYFKYQVIIHFINSLIELTSLHPDLPQRFDEIPLNQFRRKAIARCCVHDDLLQILQLFEELHTFLNHAVQVYDADLVRMAVLRSSQSMIDHVCKKYEKFNENCKVSRLVYEDKDKYKTLLHVAVKHRMCSVVVHLVNCFGFRELLQEHHDSIRDVLYHCVRNSQENNLSQIEEKVEIIRFISGINRNLLNSTENPKLAPLLASKVDISLLIECVRCGGNVLAVKGKTRKTILTAPRTPLESDEYYRLVTSIPEASLKKLVRMETADGISPLHRAVEITSPDKRTLELFRMAGADFGATTPKGENALHYSVKTKGDLECAKNLLETGMFDWSLLTRNGASLLHLAARVKVSNDDELVRTDVTELVKHLVSLGLDMDAEDRNGDTPLEYAFHQRHSFDLELVQTMVDLGGRFHSKPKVNDSMKDVFRVAFEEGCIELARLLIKGSSFDWANSRYGDDDDTTLHFAVAGAVPDHIPWNPEHTAKTSSPLQYEFTELLLASGADINAVNAKGYTPLHAVLLVDPPPLTISTFSLLEQRGGLSSPEIASLALKWLLTSKVELGPDEFEEIVRKLIDKAASINPDELDSDGNTLLHLAMQLGNVHGAKYLLKSGSPSPCNVKNRKGRIPLLLMMDNWRVKDEVVLSLAKLLVEHGANLNIPDDKGNTVIHKAITHRCSTTLEYLVETKQFEDVLASEQLVCYAVKKGDLRTVKVVCSAYSRMGRSKQLSAVSVWEYKTLLHAVAHNKASPVGIMDYLLSHEDVRSLLFDTSKCSDLVHELINVVYLDCMDEETYLSRLEKVLAINNNLVNSVDRNGKAPLLIPRLSGKLLQCLLKQGADINAKDADGNYFIHEACSNLDPIEFHELLKSFSKQELRQVLSLRGGRGRSVLHTAVLHMTLRSRTLELFVDGGADFNATDENHESVFFYAIKGGRNKDFLEMLIDFGSDWSLKNAAQASALHVAALYEHLAAVKLLISLGCGGVNDADLEGNTPLHFNFKKGHHFQTDIERVLCENGANINARNKQGATPRQPEQWSLPGIYDPPEDLDTSSADESDSSEIPDDNSVSSFYDTEFSDSD